MSTQATTAGDDDGSITRPAAQWSDLSDDLLGAVRSRIASPRDLVRYAAVGRQPLCPTTPLLLVFSRTHRDRKLLLCGPEDGWAVGVPSKVANMRFVGSYDGGWVAALGDGDVLVILNLFSGAEVVLTEEQSMIRSPVICSTTSTSSLSISKIIFSGDPSSSDGCILAGAAILKDHSRIAVCRVGCQDGGGWTWTTRLHDGGLIGDIAFCDGELYALTWPDKLLIKCVISVQANDKLAVTAIKCCDCPPWNDDTYGCTSYIVELHGKPSMAVRGRWLPDLDPFFKVFKLVGGGTGEAYKHKWTELTCLGDHALFLGMLCSKAMYVPIDIEHQGLKRNHIYHNNVYYSNLLRPHRMMLLYSVKSNNGGRVPSCTARKTKIWKMA